jgi:hypothetical protein
MAVTIAAWESVVLLQQHADFDLGNEAGWCIGHSA